MVKKVWDAAREQFGDLPRGPNKPALGMRARSAAGAGVVKDVPAPASWQKLSAELEQAAKARAVVEPAVKKPARPVIKDGVVEMSAAELSEMFFDNGKFTRLRKSGVKSIRFFSEHGGSGLYVFATSRPEDINAKDDVCVNDVRKFGISLLLGNDRSKAITNLISRRVVGYVTDITLSDEYRKGLGKVHSDLLPAAAPWRPKP